MKHLVGTNTYRSHLLHVESLAQSETDVEFGYVESERLLLGSIEEVRDEVQRRYRNTLQEPVYVESDTDEDLQVGWVYSYEAEVGREHDFKTIPYRDFVRVHQLQGETIDPNEWKMTPRIKESHLEEELADSLQKLLDCTELNLDEIEPETRESIDHAQHVLDAQQPKQ